MLLDYINEIKYIQTKYIPIKNKQTGDFLILSGKAFDTGEVVNHAVSNIVCSIVYGKRFEYDDPDFRGMVARSVRNTQLLGCASVRVR